MAAVPLTLRSTVARPAAFIPSSTGLKSAASNDPTAARSSGVRRAQPHAARDRERRRRRGRQVRAGQLDERQLFERDLSVFRLEDRRGAELERPPVGRDARGRHRARPRRAFTSFPAESVASAESRPSRRASSGKPKRDANGAREDTSMRPRHRSPRRVGLERDFGRIGGARKERVGAAVGLDLDLELACPSRWSGLPLHAASATRAATERFGLSRVPDPFTCPERIPVRGNPPAASSRAMGMERTSRSSSYGPVGVSKEAAEARGSVRQPRRRVLDGDPVFLERQDAFQGVDLLSPQARLGQDERDPPRQGRGHAVQRKASRACAGDRQVDVEEFQHALDGPGGKLRHESVQAIGALEGPAPAELPGEGERGVWCPSR